MLLILWRAIMSVRGGLHARHPRQSFPIALQDVASPSNYAPGFNLLPLQSCQILHQQPWDRGPSTFVSSYCIISSGQLPTPVIFSLGWPMAWLSLTVPCMLAHSSPHTLSAFN